MMQIVGLPSWPGETAVVIGGGPSLDIADVEYCWGCRVVGVHRAHSIAPWADLLYGTRGFWHTHPEAIGFVGVKVTASLSPRWGYLKFWKRPPNSVLQLGMLPRMERLPFVNAEYPIWQGWGAGIQAIQVAALCGAENIVLLGFDGRNNGNWHEGVKGKKYPHKFADHPEDHDALAMVLEALGVKVWNCTADSAIEAYPRARLRDVVVGSHQKRRFA